MPREFQGKIEVDIRDSIPDWGAYEPTKAPENAPNVLVILFDDTGLAAWEPYGGRINMPTLQRLAENGLTYSQWHTTSLCSPTRSSFLTGRTHHQNAFATISESAVGFPGYNGHIPKSNASVARILRDAGWSTFWVGKNHNVPVNAISSGSDRSEWPLGHGFDRFYGFIGGETNQWYPDLAVDNHYIDQPYMPEEGYHLSRDLADQAIRMLRDTKQSNPDKPWYLWFCPGANHAPHHAPQEYIDKYKGMFDDGYEAYREWVLPRMVERGILPEATEITELNPMTEGTYSPGDAVRPWDDLSDEEKQLFSRMAEVFAGFSEFTDAQVGRVIEHLEKSGQLDNTLIIYAADNGASGEGSPNGSINENLFFNGYPESIDRNLGMIDHLGGPEAYNHYPTGWAVAFSTPFRMFKRYSYAGGSADPLVISWPAGIAARGEVRNQYHHCTDIVPTILEACGVTVPDVVDGVEQTPMPGVPMNYSFDSADAPTTKQTQYYELGGTRGIWHNGWKAVAEHGPIPIGLGHFDSDRWQLFHVDEDRAEAHDVAEEFPDKLAELTKLWQREAEKYGVLPLNDLSVPELVKLEYHLPVPADGRYTYYPQTTEVQEQLAARTQQVSFKILADVDFTPNTRGVIVAQGSRFGGYSLYVDGGRLSFVYNFLGIPPEQRLETVAPINGRHMVGVGFEKSGTGPDGEGLGTLTLYVDDEPLESISIRTQLGRYALTGEGLSVGYDSGDTVTPAYPNRFSFTGGEIHKVVYDVADDHYIDVEREFAARIASD